MFEQEKGWILLGETLEKKQLIRKKTGSTIVCHKELLKGGFFLMLTSMKAVINRFLFIWFVKPIDNIGSKT